MADARSPTVTKSRTSAFSIFNGWHEQVRALSQPSSSAKPSGDVLRDLGRHIVELETELAGVDGKIRDIAARALSLQSQWQDAVRSGSADTAHGRSVFREHEKLSSTVDEFDADATVLRAMIDECRDAIAQVRSTGTD